MRVLLKRAYAPPASSDGLRILVDRLWPRGVSKDAAKLDAWLRDLAPSDELRRWFHARPSQWLQFRRRYLAELTKPAAAHALDELYALARQVRPVTLIFASRDPVRNQAVILKELLEGMRKPPSSSGPLKAGGQARAVRRALR